MKKLNTSVLLLCAIILFCSCGKENKTTEKVSDASQKNSVNESIKETISSVVLYDGTPFYVENSEGKMVWANEAPIGEQIRIFLSNNSIEQKEAIRLLSSGKEESFNFIHVSYYDEEYWTRDIFITNNAQLTPAVIKEDAIVYTAADGTAATTKKLDKYTIVSVNQSSKAKDADLNIDFIPVTYYNGAAFGREVYIKAENISTNNADILALQTLNKIASYKELKAEVAENIFNSLNKLSVSEFIKEKITEAEETFSIL